MLDNSNKGAVMKKILLALFIAGIANLGFAAVPPLTTHIVASGLDRPLFATAPNGDPRLFVVEQGGLIKVLQIGTVLPTPLICPRRSIRRVSAAFWD